jgi:UDP-N-acetylglucosamine 2-epimerase
MYHPDITDIKKVHTNTKKILDAVHKTGLPVLWFWPNADAGAEDISQELRIFKDEVKSHKIRFMRYLGPKDFLWLLNNSMCLVGNSSAGIKETSFIGLPVVNIGTRQNNRLHSENVISVEHDTELIYNAIMKQVKKGKYTSSKIYLGKETSKNIAKVLATVPLYSQKKFVE